MSERKMPHGEFYEMAIRARLPLPEGYEACGWQALRPPLPNDPWARKITYGFVSRYKSGKRKGEKKWSNLIEVVVTTDEAEAARARWLLQGGKCVACVDEKKRLLSVSVVEGAKYGPCPSCCPS